MSLRQSDCNLYIQVHGTILYVQKFQKSATFIPYQSTAASQQSVSVWQKDYQRQTNERKTATWRSHRQQMSWRRPHWRHHISATEPNSSEPHDPSCTIIGRCLSSHDKTTHGRLSHAASSRARSQNEKEQRQQEEVEAHKKIRKKETSPRKK